MLRGVKRLMRCAALAGWALAVGLAGGPGAVAAPAGTGWSIASLAQPSSFQSSDFMGPSEVVYVNATGGTFTLLYRGEETSPIAHDASAQEVRAALEALPSIGPGNVQVSGGQASESGVSRYTVSYTGNLAPPAFVEQLQANGTGLTGGTQTAGVQAVRREDLVGDSYLLKIVNTGSKPSHGTVTITDTLPAGVVAEGIGVANPEKALADTSSTSVEKQEHLGFVCTVSPTVKCEYSGSVPAGGELLMRVFVTVAAGVSGTVVNSAVVEGGGAPGAVSTGQPATVPNGLNEQPASFGVQDFNMLAYGQDGAPDLQSDSHPYSLTATFDLSSAIDPESPAVGFYAPVEEMKDVYVDLPLGLAGDPQAVPQCKESDLTAPGPAGVTACPLASRVGTIDVNAGDDVTASSLAQGIPGNVVSAVYNMTPEKGYPAVFGFNFGDIGVLLYASVVHTSDGYALRAGVPGVLRTLHPAGVSLSFFGDPATRDGGQTPPAAFFTNPADCSAGPLRSKIEVDSWLHPGQWSTREALTYPGIEGCDLLRFEPSLTVTPETTQADAPSGYTVDLKVPQQKNELGVLATPPLKGATVSLPQGVSISPGAADGLQACSDAQFAVDSTDPASCPLASQVATVTASTPVLPDPVAGQVFVGAPECDPCTAGDAQSGRMLRLFMQVSIPGATLKFPATVSADPVTGRLTATFAGLVQQPVSDVSMQFKGGPRAALANPQSCGAAASASDLVPWSSPMTPDATPSPSFAVDWDGAGGACPAALPFAPRFEAGVTSPSAGAFSPFTLTLSRGDREQDVSGLGVRLPPGLLGSLKSVPLCGEPQASQGACGAQSRIGSVKVAAGAGSHPFWLEGQAYLTGPYKGAPFGLSVVVPVDAGPFHLGNVTVRAAIRVDPHTAQVTVDSDPLPQIVDGVPVRLRTINVTTDRPGFTFNPTNCGGQQVTATITSAQGASAAVSSPFAVAGCAGLPFKPSFTVSTQAKTSKKNGASLDVKVAYPAGAQANIRSVAVTLPKALPSRLSTIQQACPQATFAANPASCPAGSNIGIATAHTPVLANPVTGPAYLVSHGGAAFPDLVVILQGEGVTLELVGSINIKKGVTSSAFASVPDAPIGSFELKLPEGPHSGLAAVLPAKAKGSLCGTSLTMPTTLTGQNGAVVKQNTKIVVTGCPKAKKKAKKHAKSKKKRKG